MPESVAGDPWFYDRVVPGTDILPFGIKVGHTWHEVGVLMRLVEMYRVCTFVELGVHEGGLASLLVARTMFDPGFCYFGVERDIGQTRLEVKAAIASCGRAELVEGDIFLAHDAVRNVVVTSAGRVLVYCDGGDKPKELAAFRDVLRRGDLIGAHDFQDGNRVVRDLPYYGGRIFPTPEVVAADLEPMAENFTPLPDYWTAETRIVMFERG